MDATLDSEDIALLNRLSDKQKDYALTLYTAREKKKSTAYILWILFGVYYFYLGHPFKNILLWLLCFCVIGEIWWIVDLFRMPGMVKRKNKEILMECIKEAAQLYPAPPSSDTYA